MRYFRSHHKRLQNTLIYQYLIADSYYQSEVLLPQIGNPVIVESTDHVSFSLINSEKFRGSVLFQEEVLIGDHCYAITLYQNTCGYLLEHKNNEYCITSEGIKCPLNEVDIILLFGPAMMLNLALNRIYCVHASAFTIKQHTFILMADSGTGKSTIARFMNGVKQAQRIADDILPLSIINEELTILPNFPQLKLNVSDQYIGSEIRGNIVLLFAQVSDDNTELSPINALTGMKKLIKHTVASRLFAADELDGHMQFCYQASQQCQHYLLNYQHDNVSSLNQLYELLNDLC